MTSSGRIAAIPVQLLEAPGETWFASEVVVTTKDGTVLTCIPHALHGVLTPRHWRWILIDQRGSQYIGPAIDNDRERGSLAERVSEWWDARYELTLV